MGNGGWSVAGSGHHPVDQMPRLQRAGKGLMTGNVSSMDHAALAMSLAGRLQDGGTPDHLARLFSVVPRHRFLPDVYWTEDRTRVDRTQDRKSTRLNSSHVSKSYAVFCLKKIKL